METQYNNVNATAQFGAADLESLVESRDAQSKRGEPASTTRTYDPVSDETMIHYAVQSFGKEIKRDPKAFRLLLSEYRDVREVYAVALDAVIGDVQRFAGQDLNIASNRLALYEAGQRMLALFPATKPFRMGDHAATIQNHLQALYEENGDLDRAKKDLLHHAMVASPYVSDLLTREYITPKI